MEDEKSCWDGALKRLVIPETITPLPVLTEPVFPNATKKLIQVTNAYVPGSSSLVEPKATPISEEANKIDDNELGEKSDKKEPSKINTTTTACARKCLPSILVQYKSEAIQLLMIICFSIALLVALAYDGYKVQTVRGLPQTAFLGSTFWPDRALTMSAAKSCGINGVDCLPFETNETWIGFNCMSGSFMQFATRNIVLRGGKDGIYSADSNICAAALHAGVIDWTAGGCFEVRLTGAKDYFYGSYANGFNSTDFGSFISGIQMRSVSSVDCGNTRAVSIVVGSLGFIAMSLIWRVDALWLNHAAAQWNFYYNGLFRQRANGNYWIAINELSAKQFTLIPMSIFLFHFFGRPGFCPDPKRFPLEAFVFFCVFFWIAAQIDNFTDVLQTGFNFSGSSASKITPGVLAILIVLAVFGVFFAYFQLRDIYRAGLMKYYYPAILIMSIYFIIVAQASQKGLLSFHFHHYFIGLILCILGRGQGKYSIILQAIGLALFVEGLSVWDTDPMFDQTKSSVLGYQWSDNNLYYPTYDQNPIVTRIEFDLSLPSQPRVYLEWTMPSDLLGTYNCSRNVTAVLPEFFTKYLNKTLSPDLTVKTPPMPYVMAQNGILLTDTFPNSFMNRTFSVDTAKSTLFTVNNPAVFIIGSSGSGSSVNIPIPYPLSTSYYDVNADLCDRLLGIYTKLDYNNLVNFYSIQNITAPDYPWWMPS